ncbi:hypothetical protein BASA81_003146 [Batrachochytrium salamandrivorans]|nr:hypothetical protein BASA81_003146 [Batrachochytrium salamandrivorans]
MIPKELEAHWGRQTEFPGIPKEAFPKALLGLVLYFDLASKSPSNRQQTALPSVAADSVWHAWMDWDKINNTQTLREFSTQRFGGEMSHLEAVEFNLPPALLETFARNCEWERKSLTWGEIPTLFDLDFSLRVPFGFAYERTPQGIAMCVLDELGNKPPKVELHPTLTEWEMYKAGLIAVKPLVCTLPLGRNIGAGCGAKCGGNCGGKCGGVVA